jgi:predicted NBD/HSP70 family sugar kinase
VTRAELAQRLGLSSGSATEITARLRAARLLSESPAPAQGRGRPTTVLRPHERGPLVLAAQVGHRRWRCVSAGVDGVWQDVAEGRHGGGPPEEVLGRVRDAVAAARARLGARVRALSVSAPGVVSGTWLRQAAPLGWEDVDLAPMAGPLGEGGAPLLVGNDATLSGVAEARTGAARGARAALTILVAGGTGGALVLDGRPVLGATGAAGEFGHLPMGGSRLRCTCGAVGCWDLTVGVNALARHLGEPAPATDPEAYARSVIEHRDRPEVRRALAANASALGGGIAGLVNALDPDVVTLCGLAVDLRAAAPRAFGRAFTSGLMHFRARAAPPVLDSRHGEDGALLGAVAVGLDAVLDERAIADWVALVEGGRAR